MEGVVCVMLLRLRNRGISSQNNWMDTKSVKLHLSRWYLFNFFNLASIVFLCLPHSFIKRISFTVIYVFLFRSLCAYAGATMIEIEKNSIKDVYCTFIRDCGVFPCFYFYFCKLLLCGSPLTDCKWTIMCILLTI